jgi:hypothetical protein
VASQIKYRNLRAVDEIFVPKSFMGLQFKNATCCLRMWTFLNILLEFLLGGSCKSHTWLSSLRKESSYPDSGYISLESLEEGIFLKSIISFLAAENLVTGFLSFFSIETPCEAFPSFLLYFLQAWKREETQKEKEIASGRDYQVMSFERRQHDSLDHQLQQH